MKRPTPFILNRSEWLLYQLTRNNASKSARLNSLAITQKQKILSVLLSSTGSHFPRSKVAPIRRSFFRGFVRTPRGSAVVRNESQTKPISVILRHRRIACVRRNVGSCENVESCRGRKDTVVMGLWIIARIESEDYSSCVCDNAPEGTRCLTDNLTVALWCESVRNDEQRRERTEDFWREKISKTPYRDLNFRGNETVIFYLLWQLFFRKHDRVIFNDRRSEEAVFCKYIKHKQKSKLLLNKLSFSLWNIASPRATK